MVPAKRVSTSTVEEATLGCWPSRQSGKKKPYLLILNKEGYHSISQCHAIPCGQHLIGANFPFLQNNDPKHTSKLCKNYVFREEAISWYSVCNGVASAVTRSQPYLAVVGAA